jgi:uncharacterized protein (DUF697 family)
MAMTKNEARVQARTVVHNWVLGTSMVAWIPGSHFILNTGDIAMCLQVARIFNVPMSRSMGEALLGQFLASKVGSMTAHTIMDFIPGIGQVAKIITAGAMTKAVGEMLIQYFYDASPLD